ncbi:MAG: ATP-dependent helicase HrpB, partial [Sphingomonadales bacterium]|nr:ATP-dependent helicase HrpB [Sphingomonadales bacterium]
DHARRGRQALVEREHHLAAQIDQHLGRGQRPEQHEGRAAHQGPGAAYRLWEEAAHPGRAPFDPPEMLVADLAPLALTLAQWGAGDPAAMAWIDPPPAAAMSAARGLLRSLGALDEEGHITPHGSAMAALPLEPRPSHMLLHAALHGAARDAAELGLLLQERGLGGRSDDLQQRLDNWRKDRSPRAEAARQLAARWASRVSDRQRDRAGDPPPLAAILAAGFPDMLARRRDASGEHWLTAGGRGLRLDPASPLIRSEWLAVGDAQGDAKGARITGAIALGEAEVLRWLSFRIERAATLRWMPEERRVEALLEQRLGAIVLSRGPDPAPDPAAIARFLADKVREDGLDLLPLSATSRSLLARARYTGLDELSDQALRAEASDWLLPLLGRRLDSLDKGALHEALQARLDYPARQQLDRLAPAQFVSPAGTRHEIDYTDPGGPSVEVRVQALFGLDRHPTYGQPAHPLLLKLTSPAGRPLQTTRDLPGFWRGSWRDVVKDMKGRYPRHRWPDEPWAEDPSLKTRNAFEAQRKM